MRDDRLQSALSARLFFRKLKNRLMMGLLGVAALGVLAPLFLVFFYVLQQGLPALNIDFFTQIPKPVGEAGGGMANALVGTLILIGLGGAIGIPWGIAVGVYLSEYSRARLVPSIRFAIDLLTSVPSIIIGLFVYAVLVLTMKKFSALAGGCALAVLMIPTVARTTEEILKLIPTHIREAGLALGIPRWKVISRVVLRGGVGGIATGVMLAVARAAGETAPLLFTAFGNNFWARGLDQPIASVPVQIYTYAISPFEEWHRMAWAGAFVLVCLVLVLNLTTRLVLLKFRRVRTEN